VSIEPEKFQVSLPDEFRPFLDQFGTGKSLAEKVKIALAIEMYFSKRVSLGKAAQLAGMNGVDFTEVLRQQGLPWMEYTEEAMLQDDITIRELEVGTLRDAGER